jgi:hypothetical protein
VTATRWGADTLVMNGSNDLIVTDVIRRNELQAWFVAEDVVNVC